jgi:hypothetical protein
VSSFPSISIPSIPMPIPSFDAHFMDIFLVGGEPWFQHGRWNSFHLHHSYEWPDIIRCWLPFGWNIPSGFGVVPSQDGVVVCQEVLNSHGLAHLSLGACPLGG